MSFTEVQLSSWLAAFLWPLFRIGAMVATAPIFSARQTPKMVRIGFALVLTWLIVPIIPQPPVVDVLSPTGFLMVLQQLALGIVMGFLLKLVFGAVVFAGQLIAYSMGLGFASMVDPLNGVQVPVISQFYLIITTLLFLVFNGHLLLIELLVESFHTFPVAVDGITRNGLYEVVGWGSRMFSGGLLLALPVMAALLLVNMGMGVVTRAAPQLNIFAVGFPLTILIGFVLMWISLPNVAAVFQDLLGEALQFLQRLLGIAG
ncbi:MAG: flagellar biosynthetic protein FliR [Gammaproteobacteria bacterium]|nr:flagellar biosynthetic protein FliR [Gammaproteobacteria bacterium]